MTTIKEIAAGVNASYSAVSRALNGKKGVNPELRKKIIELAKDMNYFPHSSAQALVQKKVGVIGVIIPRTGEFAFQNPYYSHILMGLSQIANAADYQLMLSLGDQQSYTEMYHRRLVDGVVIVANRLDDPLLMEVIHQHIPVVAVPGLAVGSEVEVPSVNSENIVSFKQALKYLLDLGHRRIAFITGKENSLYTTERGEAYRTLFKEHNIPINEDYICESDFSKTDGFRLMGDLLDLAQPPTAVICMNDLVAPGAIQQIYRRGLKIPEQISVIGIGCSENFELYHPPLTAIRTQVQAVGNKAAQILIEQIETGGCREKRVIIDSELIVRQSTTVPPS